MEQTSRLPFLYKPGERSTRLCAPLHTGQIARVRPVGPHRFYHSQRRQNLWLWRVTEVKSDFPGLETRSHHSKAGSKGAGQPLTAGRCQLAKKVLTLLSVYITLSASVDLTDS